MEINIAALRLRLQQQATCAHENRSGGNDYIECWTCWLMWDSRKETAADAWKRDCLTFLTHAEAREQEIAAQFCAHHIETIRAGGRYGYEDGDQRAADGIGCGLCLAEKVDQNYQALLAKLEYMEPDKFAARAVEAARREAEQEIARLRAELDEAIAHDRQPYPTAYAYEQTCKALHAAEAHVEALRTALQKLPRYQEHEVVRGSSMTEYLLADDVEELLAAIAAGSPQETKA